MHYTIYLITRRSTASYVGLSRTQDLDAIIPELLSTYASVKEALASFSAPVRGLPFVVTSQMRQALNTVKLPSRNYADLFADLRSKGPLLRHLTISNCIEQAQVQAQANANARASASTNMDISISLLAYMDCDYYTALKEQYRLIVELQTYQPFGLNSLHSFIELNGHAASLESGIALSTLNAITDCFIRRKHNTIKNELTFLPVIEPTGLHYPNCAASALFTLLNLCWRTTGKLSHVVVQYMTTEQYKLARANVDDCMLMCLTDLAAEYVKAAPDILTGAARINYKALRAETALPEDASWLEPVWPAGVSDSFDGQPDALTSPTLPASGTSGTSDTSDWPRDMGVKAFIPFMVWPNISVASQFFSGGIPDPNITAQPAITRNFNRSDFKTAYGCLWRKLPIEPLGPGELF